MNKLLLPQRKRMSHGLSPTKGFAEGGSFPLARQSGSERPEADIPHGRHFGDNERGNETPRVGGGSRKPKVPEYADDVIGDRKKPEVVTRGGRREPVVQKAQDEVVEKRGHRK